MPNPSPLSLKAFTGILILDNTNHEARLLLRDSTGNPFQAVLMIDTAPTGGFIPAEITAAWQHYSAVPGLQSGVSTITVVGFVSFLPNSNQPLIHVVRG